MRRKLYVGNLSFKATDDDLRNLFARIGSVESAQVVTDRETGRTRGFGFVDMATDDEAQKAIEALDGTSFMERILTVNLARPQEKKSQYMHRHHGRPGGRNSSKGNSRDRGGRQGQ